MGAPLVLLESCMDEKTLNRNPFPYLVCVKVTVKFFECSCIPENQEMTPSEFHTHCAFAAAAVRRNREAYRKAWVILHFSNGETTNKRLDIDEEHYLLNHFFPKNTIVSS